MARHIEIWKVNGKYQVEADTESGTEVLMVLDDVSELEQLMSQAAVWVNYEIKRTKCPD